MIDRIEYKEKYDKEMIDTIHIAKKYGEIYALKNGLNKDEIGSFKELMKFVNNDETFLKQSDVDFCLDNININSSNKIDFSNKSFYLFVLSGAWEYINKKS